MPVTLPKIRLVHILITLVAIVALHFFAVFAGVYDAQIARGFVWFDNLLHALVGVAFGLLWLYVVHARAMALSLRGLIFSIFAIVFVFAVVWELLELIFLLVAPTYAYRFAIYSPSIVEASFDIASNLVGAAILALMVRMWHTNES